MYYDDFARANHYSELFVGEGKNFFQNSIDLCLKVAYNSRHTEMVGESVTDPDENPGSDARFTGFRLTKDEAAKRQKY